MRDLRKEELEFDDTIRIGPGYACSKEMDGRTNRYLFLI